MGIVEKFYDDSGRLYEELKSLGFGYDGRESMNQSIETESAEELTRRGWSFSVFNLEPKENKPGRQLTLRTHKTHGIEVMINSVPFQPNYHYSTGKPVNGQTALDIIKDYLVKI